VIAMVFLGAEIPHPWFLVIALLALPAFWWSTRSAGRVVFSSLRALPAGGTTWRTELAWLPDALVALAVVAFAIALSGPRKGDQSSRVHDEGIGIVMAVDISGSMRAQDLADSKHPATCNYDAATDPTRLGAVKRTFEHFVSGGGGLEGRPDDAIGLVAFAHYADTRSPLTLDHGNLVVAARQLDFASGDEDGTAIGAGLELAVQRIADFPGKSKVVVLLTDGESNIHDIDEDDAIRDAVKAGVKVYTIGAGTNGIAPIRIPTEDGGSELRQMRVSIDETLLRKIADRTGGRYFRATDHASLEHIYEEIDKLERTTNEQEHFVNYNQYYAVALAFALGCLAISWLLSATLLRRLP
jgi:Ca-activated chloride channel family protein